MTRAWEQAALRAACFVSVCRPGELKEARLFLDADTFIRRMVWVGLLKGVEAVFAWFGFIGFGVGFGGGFCFPKIAILGNRTLPIPPKLAPQITTPSHSPFGVLGNPEKNKNEKFTPKK